MAHSRLGVQQISKVASHCNFSLAFTQKMVLSMTHESSRSRSTVISILLPVAAARRSFRPVSWASLLTAFKTFQYSHSICSKTSNVQPGSPDCRSLSAAVIGPLGESGREHLLLPPDSLPSGNQYLQFQNLSRLTATSALRGLLSARWRSPEMPDYGFGGRGIRFSELVGWSLRPQSRWSFWQWASR